MGFAFRHGLVLEDPPLSRDDLASATRKSGLPAEIGFLREFGVDEELLTAAVQSARRSGMSPAADLVDEHGVSATLYVYSLSKHLGLAYIWAWPDLAHDADAVTALRVQRVRLADGRWLIAPDDAAVRVLLAATRRADLDLSNLAVTTPAHFQAIIRRRLAGQIAHVAADALADAAPHLSARAACKRPKVVAWILAGTACFVALCLGVRLVADAVSMMFFAALVFRLLVCAAGLTPAPATVADEVGDAALPVYSVLVPLHDEASMVSGLVANLAALDYPRAKLEVLFLVEADDVATRLALLTKPLPSHMRVFIVPEGQPRTKPRALNAGLLVARGELITVYDAEDQPDPGQLRQAASRFARSPADLACLQARLVISNGDRGLMPRLFAIEYAALFDLLNVGTARLGLPIALGGTSNHFRSAALRRVGGWDAYNVTEDADLGLRLARFGYGVGDLPSSTAESAVETVGAWFHQRRRWTKGWMQTALVLSSSSHAWRQVGGVRSGAIALMLVNLVIGPMLSPFILGLLVFQSARWGLPKPQTWSEVGETTLWASVFVLGLSAPLWCAAAGMRVRGLRDALALALVIPYQLIICAAAWGGLLDLLVRPHHWRKTTHIADTPMPTRSSPAAPQPPRTGHRRWPQG